MSKSIIQKDMTRCFLCGRTYGLEEHHVMSGTANRKLSTKYKLTVMLCGETCHRGKEGVHQNRKLADHLKRLAQIAFEARYSHELWMNEFKKNYL